MRVILEQQLAAVLASDHTPVGVVAKHFIPGGLTHAKVAHRHHAAEAGEDVAVLRRIQFGDVVDLPSWTL